MWALIVIAQAIGCFAFYSVYFSRHLAWGLPYAKLLLPYVFFLSAILGAWVSVSYGLSDAQEFVWAGFFIFMSIASFVLLDETTNPGRKLLFKA